MSALLRAARDTDAGKLAAMMTAAIAELEWKPKLHTGAEDIAHVGAMIDRGWVTVADDGDTLAPLGFLARNGEEVNALFVAPRARGQGIGRALLNHAKQSADRLILWTFQANTGAQKFYLREGFVEVRRTDGRDNDEGLPDILFRWQRPTMHGASRRPPSDEAPT